MLMAVQDELGSHLFKQFVELGTISESANSRPGSRLGWRVMNRDKPECVLQLGRSQRRAQALKLLVTNNTVGGKPGRLQTR